MISNTDSIPSAYSTGHIRVKVYTGGGRRREIAEGTMDFHFEKPPGFAFKAGHALAWTLIDPPEIDAEGGTRNISIASAPGEPDLMIAIHMRDTAFKRVHKTM